MFEFKEYKVATVGEIGSADMVNVLLEDANASYFLSNTSLGFIPKRGCGSVCEYVLTEYDKAIYLNELKEGDKVIAKLDDKIFFSRVKKIENIKPQKAIMVSVGTGRNLFEHWFSQKYSTFSLNKDEIDGKIVNEIKVGDIINCFEDTKQRATHFGTKLEHDELLIEV